MLLMIDILRSITKFESFCKYRRRVSLRKMKEEEGSLEVFLCFAEEAKKEEVFYVFTQHILIDTKPPLVLLNYFVYCVDCFMLSFILRLFLPYTKKVRRAAYCIKTSLKKIPFNIQYH